MENALILILVPAFVDTFLFASCNNSRQSSSSGTNSSNESASNNNNQLTQERLQRFDSLDFQFYYQKGDRFTVSQDANQCILEQLEEPKAFTF